MAQTATDIANCWEFRCPLKWESLATTQHEDVRYCGVCDEQVYFYENLEAALRRSGAKRCVAIKTVEFEGPETGEQQIIAGTLSPQYEVGDLPTDTPEEKDEQSEEEQPEKQPDIPF